METERRDSRPSASSGGIGFLGLLTVLFIGLRLTGYIGWPWILVLLPTWGPFALVVLMFAVGFTVSLCRGGRGDTSRWG